MVRVRLTKKQLTSRPDHLWPELWKSMGKNAKLKEKQKWSNERLHQENARKSRGIYFIDPEDTEFKETMKNARKKLETSVAPRNNHRYAVVVQDLATQWIQTYPCKNKTSQETQRSLQKFLEPAGILKSFILTSPWNSVKLLKICPGITARQHHTDQKQMGLLKSSAQSKGRHLCCIVAIRSE